MMHNVSCRFLKMTFNRFRKFPSVAMILRVFITICVGFLSNDLSACIVIVYICFSFML